ncbi:radical SAM protein, partial [Candidatus Dependentiae bacterium]|nr:radical SAM protein [Candidatus Dependentiae bacterium]
MKPKLLLDSHKLLWHLDRLKDWNDGKRIAPVHIDMGLSKDCNLRCLYCYGKVQKLDRSVIPGDALIRFLKDAAEIGVKSVAMIGDGEPLMNKSVYDAIDAGYESGLDLSVGTNGVLLKKDKLPEMLKKLVYLRFNISAAEPKSYSFIHQCPEKCFYSAIENIKECVKIKKQYGYKVTIGLQMVLIPECLDQVVPLAKLGAELETDYCVIKHCSDSETRELNIPLEIYPQFEPVLKEAEKYSNEKYQVIIKWKKIMAVGKKKYDRCLGIPFLLQISGNGDVKPCGFLFPKKGYLMGNIIKQSFTEIFYSDQYW